MLKLFKLFANRILLFFKIFALFLIALFTPRFFLLYAPINKPLNQTTVSNTDFKLGLENISDKILQNLTKINDGKQLKVGLITNQTGIDQQGNRNIDVLLKKGIDIKEIYAPEHGIDGKEKDGKKILDNVDAKTQIPIVSLYQGDSQIKKFKSSDLDNVDVFIFDMQDSGIRHYTYISILYKMMQVAAEFNKRIIVLDRPNPLGYIMEGPLVNAELNSLVSIAPIPLRHSLTMGELARYFNKYRLKKPAKLTVIPMNEYSRKLGLNGILPIFLSPNIQNINSCFGYSFLGILGNIKPFEVGLGSDHAFQYIMLPFAMNFPLIKWYELRNLLAANNIDSTITRYIKHETGEKFLGIQINIKDINKISNFNILLDILEFFKDAGIKFSFAPIFDKLVGTPKFKDFINGKITRKQFAKDINKDLKSFCDQIKDILIYKPLPKIVELRS